MKDNFEDKLKELQGSFDFEEPSVGHFNRFEAKLARETEQRKKIKWNPKTWKWLSVAAAVIISFSVWVAKPAEREKGMQLAEISPEMSETQSFFVATINKELASIKEKRNTENAVIIDNALSHLEKLEKDYKKLTLDLEETSEDKRIIYAMIANFQQRIEVLQLLLEQLDEVEEMKEEVNQA